MPQFRGMPGQGSGSGWMGERTLSYKQGDGGWDRGFPERKPGKGITFEI